MRLDISTYDAETATVDRSGVGNDYGRQGFDICIRDLEIRFEDEADAAEIARMVLTRLGVTVADNPTWLPRQ